jgi:DNA-binding NarL/FixJ family response regulator
MKTTMSEERIHAVLDRHRARVRVFDEIAARITPFSARSPLPPIRLPLADPSGRELEVLELVSQGFSNKEIGTRLFLAEDTIKTHVVAVRRKLEARNRAHAVSIAYKRGLLSLRNSSHAPVYPVREAARFPLAA